MGVCQPLHGARSGSVNSSNEVFRAPSPLRARFSADPRAGEVDLCLRAARDDLTRIMRPSAIEEPDVHRLYAEVRSRLRIRRSLRRYKIFINGAQAGTIAHDSVLDLEVPGGHHQARIDWCRSQPLTIEAAPDGEESKLRYRTIESSTCALGRHLVFVPI